MDSFGKQRLIDFYLDPTSININHGSFGLCPKVVIDAKRKHEQEINFHPETWFRHDAEEEITKIRQYVAQLVNCPPKNLFLVQNATDAYNCLLKSMEWNEGDVIAITNTAYTAIRRTTEWIRDRYKVQILDITFTIDDFQSSEKIQTKIQDTVNGFQKKIKLAVLDHIISTPGIICPIQSIQKFFEQRKIPLFIDAAQTFNHINIDLKAFGVDAYFSNFHKWGFCPISAAFLYISDKFLDVIRPALTGANFKGLGIQKEFFWTGTRDFTSYLVIKNGVEYSESFGKNAVQSHNKQLSLKAGQEMAKIWATKTMTKDERCICFMNNIQVPSTDLKECAEIANEMLAKYKCFPIFFQFNEKIFCRISCQIYNELSDYQFAANKFLEMQKERQQKIDK